MFCQKCGTKNPDNGKFCRNCGTDLGNVSNALTGNWEATEGFEKLREIKSWNKKQKPVSYESAITKIFTGLAFLIVAIVLGITGIAGGQFYWFWMLIPAFGSLGSGFAQYVQLRKTEQQKTFLAPQSERNIISPAPPNAGLPPSQTEYAAPDSRYKTGDLVPPSVAEGTTRHLEMNSEGETMTLPKK